MFIRLKPKTIFLCPSSLPCPAHCYYCFAHKNFNGEVMSRQTLNKALKMIDEELLTQGESFRICFHGSTEPLTAGVEWFKHALPAIKEKFGQRVSFSLQSNVWLVNDEFAELFRKFKVSVSTSLDGTPAICDDQRGPGYYEKTMKGIAKLREHGVPVGGYICTVTAQNADKGKLIYQVSPFDNYVLHGAVDALYCAKSRLSVSPEQMERLFMDTYLAYKENLSQPNPEHCKRVSTIDQMVKACLQDKSQLCTFGNCLGNFLAIDADGEIYNCTRFVGQRYFSLGNVNDKDDKIFTDGYYHLKYCADKMEKSCHDCPHFKYCNGGCLYNALTAKETKDPYCPAYKAMFERIALDLGNDIAAELRGDTETPKPLLIMAGEKPHPLDITRDRELLLKYIALGKTDKQCAPVDKYPEENLNTLYVSVTNKCPLKCAHCYADSGNKAEPSLTVKKYIEIIKDAAGKFRKVVITGGEPLAYSGFQKLCEKLRDVDMKGTRLVLRTSLGFEVSVFDILEINATFDEIMVSIDGTEENHDNRRGEGTYKDAVKNIKSLRAEKTGLTAVLYEDDKKEENEKAVYELAEKLGIRKVRIKPVLPIGRGEGAPQTKYTFCPEEENCISRGFRPKFSCGLGQNLYVKGEKAYPCYAWCDEDKALGDLRHERLRDILKKGELYEYCKHTVDTNEKCKTCEVRYICGGICKAYYTNKDDVDSGDFDCSARKAYLIKLVEGVNYGKL